MTPQGDKPKVAPTRACSAISRQAVSGAPSTAVIGKDQAHPERKEGANKGDDGQTASQWHPSGLVIVAAAALLERS